MKNNGIKYGLIYGATGAVLMLLAYFTDPKMLFSYLNWRSILTFALMLGLMFWSAKVTKNQKGGYITFGEALLPPFLTFIIGSLISTLVLYALISTNPELQDVAVEAGEDMVKSMYETVGMSEDQIEEASELAEAQMEGGNPYGLLNMIMGIFISAFFLGLPVSAIIAAIVKKKRPDGM
ncbi:MAG: DUF4199 domain-containing protein [Bacteroidota bacterium]